MLKAGQSTATQASEIYVLHAKNALLISCTEITTAYCLSWANSNAFLYLTVPLTAQSFLSRAQCRMTLSAWPPVQSVFLTTLMMHACQVARCSSYTQADRSRSARALYGKFLGSTKTGPTSVVLGSQRLRASWGSGASVINSQRIWVRIIEPTVESVTEVP